MLSKIFKRCFLVYFSSWMIAFPAFGDPDIVELKEGEKAPFSGTLLSDDAAAKLLVNLNSAEKKCEIFITKAVEKKTADLNYDISICKADLESEKIMRSKQVEFRDEHIKTLETLVSKPRVPNEVWFTLGVVGGVGITVAAGYALGNITTNN